MDNKTVEEEATCETNLRERYDFLSSIKTAAITTWNYALQLREEYLKTDYNGNYYITRVRHFVMSLFSLMCNYLLRIISFQNDIKLLFN